MRTSAPLILIGLATAACTPAPPPQQQASVAARSCIPLGQVVARRVAGPNVVEFDVLGGTTYRNELASPCDNLDRLGTAAAVGITTASDTSRLCAGDRVKIFDPVEIKATGLAGYPFCRLGQFTAVPTAG